MVQDNTDMCACPLDVPTVMGGTFLLRSPQDDYEVMYMSLEPASAISVSLG